MYCLIGAKMSDKLSIMNANKSTERRIANSQYFDEFVNFFGCLSIQAMNVTKNKNNFLFNQKIKKTWVSKLHSSKRVRMACKCSSCD
jgi:hypothetical protein